MYQWIKIDHLHQTIPFLCETELETKMDDIFVLKPGAHPRVGNPEVTGIPQVDSSTRQRQLISTHAEVTYLTKPPITTKPVVRTN